MEAICSSETSVGFHRFTRRYITEDGTFHSYRGENPKSNKYLRSYLNEKVAAPVLKTEINGREDPLR
jgi:hypothetical protein